MQTRCNKQKRVLQPLLTQGGHAAVNNVGLDVKTVVLYLEPLLVMLPDSLEHAPLRWKPLQSLDAERRGQLVVEHRGHSLGFPCKDQETTLDPHLLA